MTNNLYDIIIVGAGPAGLFSALRIVETFKKENKKCPSIAIFEQGKPIEYRKCPAIKEHKSCSKCEPCNIMTGVAGAGAFSDGKFPITNEFGGELWKKCGKEKALLYMGYVDGINAKFFNQEFKKEEWPKLYSTENTPYKKICTQHNLHLLEAKIRHLGTDYSQGIFYKIYESLVDDGVQFFTEREVRNISKKDGVFNLNVGFRLNYQGHTYYNAKNVIIAAGRSGSKWVQTLCKELGIQTKSNRVDIGIRFECPNEIWNHITNELYESKILYRTKTYEDEVRTFCMNPSGYVVTENTKCGITVNGHSFENKEQKSNNTNFALLVNKTLTKPFNDSNEYGEAIIKLSNLLGGGVIIQRYGDLIRGKRSTKERIEGNTVIPTLEAEPGDLSLILPKRILDDILEMIDALDHLVPGMKNDDNLLYGVEIKFYNSVVETNDNCEAKDYPGLYFIGDGAGYTHSLSQAAANGLYVGDIISKSLS